MSTDEVLTALEAHGVRYVDLWFTDILGAVKSITIPVGRVERAILEGLHFDGSAVDGFARVAESDMLLVPDPATFAVLPWFSEGQRTARMICDVRMPHGDPFIGDPRGALMKVLSQAESMGYTFKIGTEVEFFLFHTDADNRPVIATPHDRSGYYDLSEDSAQVIRHAMLSTLEDMGIAVTATHSEIGDGQHEIDFVYQPALQAADDFASVRVALRTIAQRYGLHCTFMPRPSADRPGSGMHTHQSLHDLETDANVFADTGQEYGLSDVARHFLAGQLAHARAMTAVLAPLVNSYKRLGTSFEAPVNVSWAHINRAALIRVPGVAEGREQHTRLEMRSPDPSVNPYLALTVMLKAGLDGIRRKLPLPAPLEETLLKQTPSRLRQLEVLPLSLGEALEALKQDDVILEALGQYIGDRYIEAKQQEFEAYNRYVTAWEIERYLTAY